MRPTLKKIFKNKVVFSALASCAFLLSFTTFAHAATTYSVKVYDAWSTQKYEFQATSDPGYYNVDTVLTDTSRGGYTNDSSDFKACAFTSSTSAYKVRFRSFVFDPNAGTSQVGNGCTNGWNNVYYAQLALNYLGWNPSYNIDGYWGSTTRTAIINFQSNNSLGADGVIGPATWRVLASTGRRSGSSALAAMSLSSADSTVDNWSVVRDILSENNYKRTSSSEALIDKGFSIQYKYIVSDQTPYDDVVGFSVANNIVTLSVRK